jgi:flagellar M-ring protein FliF
LEVPLLKDFWNALSRSARAGLLCGCAFILVATVGAGWWIWRPDYQVLFSDLKPQDTAAMVAELDRMKVPYKMASDGNTILVDGSTVHATRLKLMGKDIPLHGAAGFELFNNADFGMTEFAQKINYQRALQGELTRTILSLSEVQDVRVHLALPEEGLFKRATSKAKAAITLSLKAGQSLRAEQVNGIQRLVSAAVPGIAAQDVTIVDRQGIALTRPAAAEGGQEIVASALDLKLETERLLAHKATEVLERAFGAGQALASVDVSLNMDQVRVTTEDVLGSPTGARQGMAGVMVKERETIRDATAPLNGRGEASERLGNTQREIECQVGRRIEQVATQPGAIRQLHVAAVINQPVDDKQLEEMRTLVAAAVGAVPERGDSVVVQSLSAFQPPTPHVTVTSSSGTRAPVLDSRPPPSAVNDPAVASGVALLLLAATAGAGWLLRRGRTAPRRLTQAQKQVLLEQLRHRLDEAPASQASALAREPLVTGVQP